MSRIHIDEGPLLDEGYAFPEPGLFTNVGLIFANVDVYYSWLPLYHYMHMRTLTTLLTKSCRVYDVSETTPKIHYTIYTFIVGLAHVDVYS